METTINIQTLLTAQHFRPKEKHDIDFLKVHPANLCPELYEEIQEDKRVVKNKCITTAYVTFLALMHQTDSATIGDFKYHDSGIGTASEGTADTGLGTVWGGARDTGTQVASTNTYTSVATTTYNTTKAITEHGLFNSTSGATLMDRSVFSAINVVNTDSIQWMSVITFTAGG